MKNKFKYEDIVKVDPQIIVDKNPAKSSFLRDSYNALIKGEWTIIGLIGKHSEKDVKRLDTFVSCWPICYVEDKYLIKVRKK